MFFLFQNGVLGHLWLQQHSNQCSICTDTWSWLCMWWNGTIPIPKPVFHETKLICTCCMGNTKMQIEAMLLNNCHYHRFIISLSRCSYRICVVVAPYYWELHCPLWMYTVAQCSAGTMNSPLINNNAHGSDPSRFLPHYYRIPAPLWLYYLTLLCMH